MAVWTSGLRVLDAHEQSDITKNLFSSLYLGCMYLPLCISRWESLMNTCIICCHNGCLFLQELEQVAASPPGSAMRRCATAMLAVLFYYRPPNPRKNPGSDPHNLLISKTSTETPARLQRVTEERPEQNTYLSNIRDNCAPYL